MSQIIAFPQPRKRKPLTRERVMWILTIGKQYKDALAEAQKDLQAGEQYETDLRLPAGGAVDQRLERGR
jgi:hypothetical protein